MFSYTDVIWIIGLGAFVWLLAMTTHESEFKRPAVTWVEDSRNGCEPRAPIALSNDGVTKDSKFIPKLLTIYDCKNGLTAAVIEKQ